MALGYTNLNEPQILHGLVTSVEFHQVASVWSNRPGPATLQASTPVLGIINGRSRDHIPNSPISQFILKMNRIHS